MDGGLIDRFCAASHFDVLGPARHAQASISSGAVELDGDSRAVRRRLRAVCPSLPGVYGMVDEEGQLVYVGMSAHLRERVVSYFFGGRQDVKQRRIAAAARRLVWEVSAHEFTALLRELELIQRWRPRFNVLGQPGRVRSGYVFLADEEAPGFQLQRLPPRRCRQWWGPLPLSRHTRTAVQQLNQLFRLRDCPRHTPIRFPDQGQLFVKERAPLCLRADLGTCLAPCAGRCTKRQYRQAVAEACALLDGRDRRLLDSLQHQMDEAAEQLDYERAAQLRDTLESLTYLIEQTQLARQVQTDYQFVYPLQDCLKRQLWILVAGAQVRGALEHPCSPRTARHCLEALQKVYGCATTGAADDYQQMRLVTGWFRQHPDHRQQVLAPDEAMQLCRQQLAGVTAAA